MMAGFGLGGFGLGPYGAPTPPIAVEPITTAVSCRLIDGVTRDYVTDEDGNPEAEDGTANRVYLLISFADTGAPDVISAENLRARERAVRDALAPLTGGPTPAISDLRVSFTDNGDSSVFGEVSYFNLATQQAVSLPIT